MRLDIQKFAVTESTSVEESDVNTTNNTSDIKVTIKFSANNSSTFFNSKTLSCTLRCYDVNGGNLLHTYTKTKSVSHSKGGSVNTSFSFGDISHDESTGKMYVTASWSIATGTSTLGTLTDSKSKTCTQISRASTISSISGTYIGSMWTIYAEKHTTDSVYHRLLVSYDEGDTFSEEYFSQNTTLYCTVLSAYFPNLKSSFNQAFVIKLETYDDSNKTTLMGTDVKSVYALVPQYTISPVVESQLDNVNTYNNYKLNSNDLISTLSIPTLVISNISNYDADIQSATLNGVSGTINNVLHKVTFSNIEQASNYVLYVEDSRGVTVTKTFTGSTYTSDIVTVPYTPIEIAYQLERPSPTSQSMDIDITASFYDGTNLQNLETPTLTFEYSTDGGNTYTTQALTQTLGTSSITVNDTFTSTDLAFYKKTFYFRITVTDKLGVSSTTEGYIPSGQPAVYYFKYNNENYTNVYDHLLLDFKPVATTDMIPTVPTNVSDFTNDAGYLTASDLSWTYGGTLTGSTSQNTPSGAKELYFLIKAENNTNVSFPIYVPVIPTSTIRMNSGYYMNSSYQCRVSVDVSTSSFAMSYVYVNASNKLSTSKMDWYYR